MSKNSERVSHELEDPDRANPDTFRDDRLKQILHDVSEDGAGFGFHEVTYRLPPEQVFVDKIITYETAAKLKKRAEFQFAYSPFPFVSSITQTIFRQDGTAGIATVIATFTLNPNKTIKDATVTGSRP